MGSFEGHAIPSVIYTLIGIWWSFGTAIKYVSSIRNEKKEFIGTTTMSCFFFPTKRLRLFPFESCFKLVFLTIHLLAEIITTNKQFFFGNESFRPIPMESVHHICMISGFIFGSIIEILIYLGMPFPKRTEYACNFIAFLIQAILMTGKHNDQIKEMHVHSLWTLVIYLTFASACLEAYNPDCFWFIYARIFFFITQGTWLMQSAFVIWPQTTNKNYIWGTDHISNAWLDISLMFHFLGVATFLLMQYLLVYVTFDVLYKFYRKYELDLQSIHNDSLFSINNFTFSNKNIEYSILKSEDDV